MTREHKTMTALDGIGDGLYAKRARYMIDTNQGLTATYNQLKDPDCTEPRILELRALHEEMDRQVLAAYGWTDLALGHGFHETRQGTRFTISEPARREVLARLLKLNHERYAEEVAQGLHEKGKGKPKAAGRKGGKASANKS